jgi:cytochrome c556
MTLKLVQKIAVFALAVLFGALPVMACVVPNAAMTAAERECCKKMAGQCGDMGMAKSHPCCQVTATPADFHALKTASSQLHHVSLVLFHALPLTAETGAYVSLAQWSSRVSCTHSPPGLESLTTTVLRI